MPDEPLETTDDNASQDPAQEGALTSHHHEHTAFGDYEVYTDSSPICLDPSSNAVTESEFKQMGTAWDNIHHDKGMHITGTDADKKAWDQELADGMQHSETFRQTVTGIGNDTSHTVNVNLGHSQPGVFVDSFATNKVDLDDLNQFPDRPRSGHHDETTRTELIDHFLDERHYAATHGSSGFEAAHNHAIDNQNGIRDEQGQSHVTGQVGLDTDGDGKVDRGDFRYANGTHEFVDFNANLDVTKITPPNDPPHRP
jgi:hypothetical protein